MPISPIGHTTFVWINYLALTKILQVFNKFFELFLSHLYEFLSLGLCMQSLQQSSSAAFGDWPPKAW